MKPGELLLKSIFYINIIQYYKKKNHYIEVFDYYLYDFCNTKIIPKI